MAKSLQERLGDRAIILNDRAVPGSRANIDHVVVASSGVWIVDSKLWKGLIQVKTVGGFTSATQRLVVDGRDQSSHTEKIYSQVIPIANLLGDPSIPIRPALVFLDGNWGAGVSLRFEPAWYPRRLHTLEVRMEHDTRQADDEAVSA